jgi:hypothetical protein
VQSTKANIVSQDPNKAEPALPAATDFEMVGLGPAPEAEQPNTDLRGLLHNRECKTQAGN